jgi:hypothetical protein
VIFPERADNATLDVAAEMLGLPAPSLSRNTRSEMSLPARFGGMGDGDLDSFAGAAHVGANSLREGSAFRFLATQDALVRGDTHDDVRTEPTIYGRLVLAMTTAVSRRRSAPDGGDGDNEPILSLELSSSWARLDAAYGSHALAECELLVNTALAILPPIRRTVSRAGCVAEARSNNDNASRSLDGMSSLVPLPYLPRNLSYVATWHQ